eukprot:482943-Hanusia_phi.AAC.2
MSVVLRLLRRSRARQIEGSKLCFTRRTFKPSRQRWTTGYSSPSFFSLRHPAAPGNDSTACGAERGKG